MIPSISMLSYYEPAVTAALASMTMEQTLAPAG
jgi:hypothetical protein